MTYADAIQFLYSLQLFGSQFGLERASQLAQLAGNPQNQLRFIHVAGTNGKGSVCAMLESIYRMSGLRVGLYTSPHLVSFRERIQVNRELISEDDVARLVSDARPWITALPSGGQATLFEVVTVMALRYFADQNCDLVIWETGLGGRLDATNIVTPLASVITNVQFDHEKWLGNTLEEIAREKAGIIKHGVPVVTAAGGGALEVIQETAQRMAARLQIVDVAVPEHTLQLRGEHQRINAAVALKTVEVLTTLLPVPKAAVAAGLCSTHWPGRFQTVQRGPQMLVLDGAHNPAGATALVATLRAEFEDAPLTFIVGVLEDKNWPSVVRTFAKYAHEMVCVPIASRRTTLPVMLAHAAHEANPTLTVHSVASLTEALSITRQATHLVITGSLYLVGEAMELLGLSVISGERELNEWTPLR